MAPLVHPPRFGRGQDCGRRCKGGPRRAMADLRRRSGAWDMMGYHGTSWASMRQPGRPPRRPLPVSNCSLTVPKLKEWLTLDAFQDRRDRAVVSGLSEDRPCPKARNFPGSRSGKREWLGRANGKRVDCGGAVTCGAKPGGAVVSQLYFGPTLLRHKTKLAMAAWEAAARRLTQSCSSMASALRLLS